MAEFRVVLTDGETTLTLDRGGPTVLQAVHEVMTSWATRTRGQLAIGRMLTLSVQHQQDAPQVKEETKSG